MPSGNGCRANQRRERNLKDAQKGANKHTSADLKKHEESKNAIQCKTCLQGFPRTVRKAELEQHYEKHAKVGKSFQETFPNYEE